MSMGYDNKSAKDREEEEDIGYLEYLGIKPHTLEEENQILRATINELRRELNKYKRPPSIVAQVVELYGDEAIVQFNNGKFYVSIAKEIIPEIKINDKVLLDQKSLTITRILGKDKPFDVSSFVVIDKPSTKWKDIGGLKEQIREIREVIEMPLVNPEIFKEVGIEPPKGILLYGPPGTGKTLLAKAAAAHSKATFIEVVGSELVQKYIGEGSKFVKSIFELAREKAPAIIFIDEIDAIAAKRIELGTSGEREVQRTFMQLLAEIDGFKPLGNIKIIGATNRLDILDPAITRPGRLDRIIHVPYPDLKARIEIFNVHTRKMKISKDVDITKLAEEVGDKVSGADIKAICTEAGYYAIRAKRKEIKEEDFIKAIKKVLSSSAKEKKGNTQYLYG